MKNYTKTYRYLKSLFFVAGIAIIFLGSCSEVEDNIITYLSRYEAIPADAVKMTPESDFFPPVLHSDLWEDPIPMPGPVNTAGVEDAPVISDDGNLFLFFFTPDGNIPAEDQLLDGVTGIWWSRKEGRSWTEPVRAILNDDLALDGPVCFRDDILWFASFRVGNYGSDGDIYTAQQEGDEWINWQNCGEQLNLTYNTGELYAVSGGETLYFGRLEESMGGMDLWTTSWNGSDWGFPENLGHHINTSGNEGLPYISEDGNELLFTGDSQLGYTGPAIFRSIKMNGAWHQAEEIVSNHVGDPGMDSEGNLYFTHLFYDEEGNKIEADIYVAYKIR
ncbi:MAG: hypothetical protein APR54_10870 [Candidatus Cloacimonas sp. SDB]|nr:MAG: hypothetical protein APR54_10870 [Candidatus Cloacimonas sp. SDB]